MRLTIRSSGDGFYDSETEFLEFENGRWTHRVEGMKNESGMMGAFNRSSFKEGMEMTDADLEHIMGFYELGPDDIQRDAVATASPGYLKTLSEVKKAYPAIEAHKGKNVLCRYYATQDSCREYGFIEDILEGLDIQGLKLKHDLIGLIGETRVIDIRAKDDILYPEKPGLEADAYYPEIYSARSILNAYGIKGPASRSHVYMKPGTPETIHLSEAEQKQYFLWENGLWQSHYEELVAKSRYMHRIRELDDDDRRKLLSLFNLTESDFCLAEVHLVPPRLMDFRRQAKTATEDAGYRDEHGQWR